MFNETTDGYPYNIFGWILFALTTPTVFIRLYVQLRFRERPWRELFVVFSWLMYLGNTVINSVQIGLDWDNYSLPATPKNYKLDFAAILMWITTLYFCKFAVLCFYGDLIKRNTFPRLWWTLVVTWFLCVVGLGVALVDDFFECHPLHNYWSVPFRHAHRCERPNTPTKYFLWLLHIVTDFILYAIPIIIYYRSSIFTLKQRRVGLALMALGFLNVGTGTTIAIYYISFRSVKWYNFYITNGFFLPFQSGSALLVICLPYCRRFWRGANERTILAEAEAERHRAAPVASHMMTQTEDLEAGEAGSNRSKENIMVSHAAAATSTSL